MEKRGQLGIIEFKYFLVGLFIGVIVALVVLISTAGSLGWQSAFWWRANWPIVAGIVFILIVIGIIARFALKAYKRM